MEGHQGPRLQICNEQNSFQPTIDLCAKIHMTSHQQFKIQSFEGSYCSQAMNTIKAKSMRHTDFKRIFYQCVKKLLVALELFSFF